MQGPRLTRNPIRKLYDWTLHWADTRYALPALCVISFAESSFFPIPPDVLLLAICFAQPQKWAALAAWCTVSSVAGGLFGWYLGFGFWEFSKGFFFDVIPGFTPEKFAVVEKLYQGNAFLAIFTAAFTPIPYKVFTVTAGVCHVAIPALLFASILGRGCRFFLVAGLIRLGGVKAKPFIEKHFELATLALLALGIGGFLAIKLLG